jgi:hypothetical protein
VAQHDLGSPTREPCFKARLKRYKKGPWPFQDWNDTFVCRNPTAQIQVDAARLISADHGADVYQFMRALCCEPVPHFGLAKNHPLKYLIDHWAFSRILRTCIHEDSLATLSA